MTRRPTTLVEEKKEQSRLVQAAVFGVVRALGAAGGGWLVAHGYMGANEVEGFAGALGVIGVAVWSVVSKRGLLK